MISPRCFEESWIREQAEVLRARDLRTLEKNILALELVSRLQRGGLEFIFKGGTSLALFFDPVDRLSIDVDILSLEPIERLKAVLGQATTDRPPFTGYEHQERRDREAPPTVHFKIPYTSALDPGGVHSIQLDVITAHKPLRRHGGEGGAGHVFRDRGGDQSHRPHRRLPIGGQAGLFRPQSGSARNKATSI